MQLSGWRTSRRRRSGGSHSRMQSRHCRSDSRSEMSCPFSDSMFLYRQIALIARVWLNDVRLMHCAQEFLFCSYFCWVFYVLITLTVRQQLLCTVHMSNLFRTERSVCVCGYTYLFQHLSIETPGVHAWFSFSVEFICYSTCNGLQRAVL